VLVQPDGKILLAGSFTTINGVGRAQIARLNEDGTVDPGFSSYLDAASYNQVTCLALQPDGKLLMGGFLSFVNGTRPGIARLNEDGSVDSTFNLNFEFGSV